jgi:hypothetical protein
MGIIWKEESINVGIFIHGIEPSESILKRFASKLLT